MTNLKFCSLYIFCGCICGFINGFFGGGGGIIIIPLAIYLLKLPQKSAHATTLFIILPITIISAIIYSFNNCLPLDILISVCFSIIIGGIVGAFLLNKLPNTIIATVFTFIMLISGIKILFS